MSSPSPNVLKKQLQTFTSSVSLSRWQTDKVADSDVFNSRKVAAWQRSHASYISFLKALDSPGPSPTGNSPAFKSITVSIHEQVDNKSLGPPKFFYPAKVHMRPTNLDRVGGWTTALVNPRKTQPTARQLRSYNMDKYGEKRTINSKFEKSNSNSKVNQKERSKRK